jgi:hypothetical protein
LTVAAATWFPAATSAFSTLLGAGLVFSALQTGIFFRVESISQNRAPAQESVESARRFQELVTGQGANTPAKVLVVVDNLDRLEGSDALTALAEVRALVDFPTSRAIFLIPIDRGALARHIEQPLSATGTDAQPSEGPAAKDYLEKFFNLDLLLTKPELLDLRSWALREAGIVLPAGDESDLVTAAQVVASAAGGSPRSVKRILNGIASRRRLIEPALGAAPSLKELALVEGLLIQFPEIVPWLTRDPRELVEYRASLRTGGPGGPEPPVKDDRALQLRAFLLANSEIELTASQIRTMLSLRQDPVWRGVADPLPLQDALDTGQAEGLHEAISDIDEVDRAVAVLQCVRYVERSIPAFARDAVTNLIALGPVVRDYPEAEREAHQLAIRAFLEGGPANVLRMSRQLAGLLFARGYQDGRLTQLAGEFAGSLSKAVEEGARDFRNGRRSYRG